MPRPNRNTQTNARTNLIKSVCYNYEDPLKVA